MPVPEAKVLVWATVARFVTVALFFDALAPLFPQMTASNGLSTNLFQTILGACYLIFAISQLVSVPIIGVIGFYQTAAVSCIYLGFCAVFLSITNNQYVFMLLFISLFAVNSVGANATRLALREVTSNSGYKRLVGLASGLVEIKQIAMPVIAGALAAAFGWRWALVALTAPVVAIGIWIEIANHRSQRANSESDTKTSDNPGLKGWQTVAIMPAFWVPAAIAAAFQVALSPLGARLPFILFEEAHLSSAMVGLILSIDSAVVAVGLFLSGYLAPYWSSSRLLKAGIAIMAFGIAIMCSSYLLNVYYAIGGIIILQGALGFVIVPCSGDALNVPESLRTKASALFGFIQPIAGGFSVVLSGLFRAPLIDGSVALSVISIALIIVAMTFQKKYNSAFS